MLKDLDSRTIVALAALLASPVAGQAPPQPIPVDSASVVGARSPLVAGLLEFYVPTVGYAYAGDWTRGLLPTAVRGAATVAIVC